MTAKKPHIKEENFTIVNIARILVIIATIFVVKQYSNLSIDLVSYSFLGFAVVWFIIYETRALNVRRFPISEFIPPVMDISLLSGLIYLTGTVNSFLIAGYYYLITICSLNTKIPQGKFAFYLSTFLYVITASFVYLEWLPYINFFSNNSNFSFYQMIFSILLVAISNYVVFRTVHDLAIKNENLLAGLSSEKQKAEKANNHKNEILANMSHEIRTPMNAVLGITNHLIEENSNAKLTDDLNILKYSSEQLLILINDFLDLSKIEDGKIELETIEFNLAELIKNTIQLLSQKALEKKIGIEFENDPELPILVLGDKIRLGQILTNLLGNAIKFTETGAVKLQVKVLQSEHKSSTIHFSVQDSGIGIPEEKLNIIFEKFKQASSETTRKYGGTGLGLNIVSSLLSLMNSRIFVKSKLGEGSEFYFNLNFALPETKVKLSLPALEITAKKDLTGLRVLIVDDNEINIKVVERFLFKWKASTKSALGGRIALDIIASESLFDIILMDLQMPEIDGYETTKEIHKIFPNIPVIALTADVMQDIKAKIEEAGIIGFLTKPFQPEELYNTLLAYSKMK